MWCGYVCLPDWTGNSDHIHSNSNSNKNNNNNKNKQQQWNRMKDSLSSHIIIDHRHPTVPFIIFLRLATTTHTTYTSHNIDYNINYHSDHNSDHNTDQKQNQNKNITMHRHTNTVWQQENKGATTRTVRTTDHP